ncbi:MAG: hypothetical protein R3A79_27770 [Nannocystaceae bacterium]
MPPDQGDRSRREARRKKTRDRDARPFDEDFSGDSGDRGRRGRRSRGGGSRPEILENLEDYDDDVSE